MYKKKKSLAQVPLGGRSIVTYKIKNSKFNSYFITAWWSFIIDIISLYIKSCSSDIIFFSSVLSTSKQKKLRLFWSFELKFGNIIQNVSKKIGLMEQNKEIVFTVDLPNFHHEMYVCLGVIFFDNWKIIHIAYSYTDSFCFCLLKINTIECYIDINKYIYDLLLNMRPGLSNPRFERV